MKRLISTSEGGKHAPLHGHKDSDHGNYVSTVALGGHHFARLLPSLRVDIQIYPINIFEEKRYGTRFRVAPGVFFNVARRAHDGIVNLSVGRGQPLDAIEDRIVKQRSESESILFVVAAGNQGKSLSSRVVYPARYGGSGNWNVVTVAALDLDGTLAGFSNFGSTYVDIAAPGCLHRVPAVDYQLDQEATTLVSGTSLSAPLVSFTAALIKAHWPGVRPQELKTRILVASDLSPLIHPTQVAERRVLNIAKAVSLFHDQAELKTLRGRRLLRGKIEPPEFAVDCDGEVLYRDDDPTHRQVRKVSILETGEGKNLIVAFDDLEGQPGWMSCSVPNIQLAIREELTGILHPIQENSLVDLVLLERSIPR